METVIDYERDLAMLYGWQVIEFDKADALPDVEKWMRRSEIARDVQEFEDVLRSFYGMEG